LKSVILVAILLAVAWSVQAKDKPAYEKGVLLQMDSSSCGYAGKGVKTLTGEILGTDAQHKKTQEVLGIGESHALSRVGHILRTSSIQEA
jgi:hypothetical protein